MFHRRAMTCRSRLCRSGHHQGPGIRQRAASGCGYSEAGAWRLSWFGGHAGSCPPPPPENLGDKSSAASGGWIVLAHCWFGGLFTAWRAPTRRASPRFSWCWRIIGRASGFGAASIPQSRFGVRNGILRAGPGWAGDGGSASCRRLKHDRSFGFAASSPAHLIRSMLAQASSWSGGSGCH